MWHVDIMKAWICCFKAFLWRFSLKMSCFSCFFRKFIRKKVFIKPQTIAWKDLDNFWVYQYLQTWKTSSRCLHFLGMWCRPSMKSGIIQQTMNGSIIIDRNVPFLYNKTNSHFHSRAEYAFQSYQWCVTCSCVTWSLICVGSTQIRIYRVARYIFLPFLGRLTMKVTVMDWKKKMQKEARQWWLYCTVQCA